MPAALKAADRVLALDPTDTRATQIVTAVSARHVRARRVKASLLVSALVVGGATFGQVLHLSWLRRRQEARTRLSVTPVAQIAPPAPTVVPTESAPTSRDSFTSDDSDPPSRMPRGLEISRSRSRPAPTVATAVAPPRLPAIDLGYHVLPFADVAVDGQTVATGTPSGRLSLSRGHHQIVFSANAYQPVTREVEADPEARSYG